MTAQWEWSKVFVSKWICKISYSLHCFLGGIKIKLNLRLSKMCLIWQFYWKNTAHSCFIYIYIFNNKNSKSAKIKKQRVSLLTKITESGVSAFNGCFVNCFRWNFGHCIIQKVKHMSERFLPVGFLPLYFYNKGSFFMYLVSLYVLEFIL